MLWFFHTTGFVTNAFLTTAGNFGGQIIGDTIDGKKIDYEAAVASTVAGLTVSGVTSKLFRTTSSGTYMHVYAMNAFLYTIKCLSFIAFNKAASRGFLKSTKSFVKDLSTNFPRISKFGRTFLEGVSTGVKGVVSGFAAKELRDLYNDPSVRRTFSRVTDNLIRLYDGIQVQEAVKRISDGLIMLYDGIQVQSVISMIREGFSQLYTGIQGQELLSRITDDLMTLYNSPQVQELLGHLTPEGLGALYNLSLIHI